VRCHRRVKLNLRARSTQCAVSIHRQTRVRNLALPRHRSPFHPAAPPLLLNAPEDDGLPDHDVTARGAAEMGHERASETAGQGK
jgi:hypothetical protein